MKKELLNLYLKRKESFKKIRSAFPNDDIAGPLLMSPGENFITQPNPLLIIGQETNGWGYDVDDLKKQMEVYEEFNLGEYYYASPFWNVTRKVEQALGNQNYSCAWTNISKFDLDGGRAYGQYEEIIATVDNILIDEIAILQPKICVFFTGPSLDYRIKNIFKNIEFKSVEGFEERQLSQLKHEFLPELTFRTYHPNYLRRSGQEQSFINFIGNLNS